MSEESAKGLAVARNQDFQARVLLLLARHVMFTVSQNQPNKDIKLEAFRKVATSPQSLHLLATLLMSDPGMTNLVPGESSGGIEITDLQILAQIEQHLVDWAALL
jgi:hypothetical protein